jgi:glycosyltransferase involved in cell wall biosynthesis
MLVPLLSAGGIRVKIIEGMAYGKTIVSTTIGAEGLKYDNLKNIIIADSPEEFSEAALKLYKNSYNKNEIGQNAREQVVKSYDYKKISKKLVSFFDSIQ